MEKYYNSKGEFGVIVSYGFGSGWSTWGNVEPHDGKILKYLYCNDLIKENDGSEYIDIKAEEMIDVELFMKENIGEPPYMGGLNGACIEWLEEGTMFRIEEYDGAESIECRSDISWSY